VAQLRATPLGQERSFSAPQPPLPGEQKCPLPPRSNVLPLEVTKTGGSTMSEFVYLYREGQNPTQSSPEATQQMMQKWMAWFKELADSGHIKNAGQPLERSGKLVKGKQKTVTDGPFAEAKDVIGGYSLIEARNLEQAVELSKGCPIFEAEGAVEVRPVMKINM
jgi:hypothetical protein